MIPTAAQLRDADLARARRFRAYRDGESEKVYCADVKRAMEDYEVFQRLEDERNKRLVKEKL